MMDGRKYTEIIMENIKQLLIHMQEMTKYYYLLYYAHKLDVQRINIKRRAWL